MQRKKTLAVTAAVLACGAVVASTALGAAASERRSGESNGDSYEIGLWGDMPYGDSGRAQIKNVIADLNATDLAFSVFDGDIKNGKEKCTDDQYTLAASNFATVAAPVVYVPGDNEWTDCDRASNGSYDPLERLSLIRRTFFGTNRSLGKDTLRLTRQSDAYPENVRWTKGRLTYVGLNVPGSDNNAVIPGVTDGNPVNDDEYTARNAANLQWLAESFNAAKSDRSRAIMIVMQADMWSTTDVTTHYADTKQALAQLAIDFGRPVVIVNGDAHEFVVNKPLKDAKGNTIENVTRVTTFGSSENHWVSATVDPQDPQVFTFQQHIIKANEPSYVAP